MNIRLGTRYLRQMLDRFGGVQEYALAAYNAGDSRVADWQAAGPYSGIDEFVESIPFTQTREYVEAILRNEETYRAIDEFARAHSASCRDCFTVGEEFFHFGQVAQGIPLATPRLRFALTSASAPGNTVLDRMMHLILGKCFAACFWKKHGAGRKQERGSVTSTLEGTMSADLQFLEEWIPERMDPGTVFVLENQAKLGQAQNPYVAVMSCPRCGTLGLITRRQLYGGETMICGGDVCSAEYRLDGETSAIDRRSNRVVPDP